MASEAPEHPPGLTRSQLRLVLLIMIGLTLIVTGTARGQTHSSRDETDVNTQPLTAKHSVADPPHIDLRTYPTIEHEAPAGGDAARSAPAA